jgi:hypothetical protein
MRPAEIVHRVGEFGRLQGWRLRHLAGRGWPKSPDPASHAFCVAAEPQLPALDWDWALLEADAERLLTARPGALGCDWQWRGSPADWHRAPDTGRAWPRQFFGDVDYRAGNASGDARLVWEPSRLQWLVGLALLSSRPPAERAARAQRQLEAALASWLDANPPLSGVHYVSAMECALRLIAVCHALDLARARLGPGHAAWGNLLKLVVSHAPLIATRLSLHSSRGNHTIAEAAGLAYAGLLFPALPGAAAWRARGLALLVAEAEYQVLPDGGGIEQATVYLDFVQQLMALVCGLLERQGQRVPASLEAAAARAAAFLVALPRGAGPRPVIGDSDDGHALAPWHRPAWVSRAQPWVEQLRFADSGYTVLRSSVPRGLEVVFDHGPLGMPPGYGHGHADALAVQAWSGGRAVLLDTGTGSYTGEPRWRRYFRGTAAHNTVTVNGADQACQQAAFLWTQPGRTELLRSGAADGVRRVLARHDGYHGRYGVTHWRGVALHADGTLVVWDRLRGPPAAELVLRWHVPAAVPLGPARWSVGGGEGEGAVLEVRGAGQVGFATGSGDESAGWRSVRYGCREPIATIAARWHGPLPHEFVTLLKAGSVDLPQTMIDADIALFHSWCP